MNTIGAALVLLLAGTVLMLIQWVDIRREYTADAQAQARVIASSSAAAVMFGDAEGARETLAPLASVPAVRRAILHDNDSNPIASYPESVAGGPAAMGSPCGFDCAWVSAPVLLRDRQVGVVQLQIDMTRAHARLLGLGIAFCIASLVAYALAYPLMKRMRERVHGAEAQLRYLAHYDPVTRLHNRNAFNAQLESCRARGERMALIQLDLDRFKEVNDKLGHQGGDELLLQVGRRISGALGSEQYLFRLGGDEFALVLVGADAIARVHDTAESILGRFSAPFLVGGLSLGVTASAGISRWPDDAERLEELAANADIAMYCAKREGRNRVAVFEPRLREAQLARIGIRDALGQAIAAGQLELHYQPQVCARTGRLQGAEALLRWTHPELGTVPPSTFIPIAEEGSLIIELGRWVIAEACRQIAAWHGQGLGHVRLAVNLSMRQTRDEALPGFIDEVLDATGVPARCLELEVTESVLMEDTDLAVSQLARLRARGLQLAIDDFGTGYSSMAYLRRLPIDKLKIDMAFVQAVPGEGEAIATAILAMARAFGLSVVAEGVETAEQRDFFRHAGCQQLQGYFIGRALPAGTFASEWLEYPAGKEGLSVPSWDALPLAPR
ncbi:putative bifunctional diguanylate cyclase/phosphodiesterase [Luteimonas saliphila]|uniref:putative bifunctional diguanylate cyclase/phosphodiesterase n=1 Tax=Luteimonas saliphila TaxID=2804919 RepID=UPI001EE26CF0|nr:EAL domain-containing protein [Luteimonas saliphila]